MLEKKIFIVAGPSAVGKNAIVKRLLATDLPLQRMITTTSRSRRSDDRPREYHFVSREEFQALIDQEAMIEWIEFNDHLYGTRREDLENIFKADRYPVLVIDVRGAEFFKQNFEDVVSIFILPSGLSILRQRLEERGTPESDIRERLKVAQSEIKQAPQFDYRVINYDGKLENVVKEVAGIIEKETS